MNAFNVYSENELDVVGILFTSYVMCVWVGLFIYLLGEHMSLTSYIICLCNGGEND